MIGTPDGPDQSTCLFESPLTGCKAGHGIGENMIAGKSHHVHGSSTDDQCLRGVEASGNTDNQFIRSRGLEPLDKGLDLNLVNFPASFVSPVRVARHKRVSFVTPPQGNLLLKGEVN